MMQLIRKFIKPKYDTLNRIEIDAQKIRDNFAYLQSLQPGAAIFPVLKANAYGHGLKELCLILNDTKAQMVVVDSYPEAQIVYRNFRGRVLILGEMPLRAYNYTKLKRTEFVVYNEATLRHLARFGKKSRVHLFVNSGMNREGIKDLPGFIADNRTYLDKVEVVGLCSHLSSAEKRSSANIEQEDSFMKSLDQLRASGYFPRWIHLGNSAAIFWADNKLLTAFRPGLGLYGYNPYTDDEEVGERLSPALEIYTQIVAIQDVVSGESVSYSETFRADKDGRIAVVPFGYYEGLDRRLSGEAEFLISGHENYFARVAGRVCMNLTCLDVDQRNVEVGDEVQIVSGNRSNPNSAENIASQMDTIVYEFLVKFPANIRRIILNLKPIKRKN